MTTKDWIGGLLVASSVAACGDDTGSNTGTETETETDADTSGDDDPDPTEASDTEPDPDTSTSADPDTSTGPDPDSSSTDQPESSSSSSDTGPDLPPAEFFVRIENISGESVLPGDLSAGVWVEQEIGTAPVFALNAADSGDGLVPLAEDGDHTVLAGNVDALAGAVQSGTWDEPIAPGGMVEFTFTAQNSSWLSLFTQVSRSNDTFIATGPFGVNLFTNQGLPVAERDITHLLRLYEVGSEYNQAPGQGPQQGATQPAPDTGMDESGEVVAFASSTRALPQAPAIVDVQVVQDAKTGAFTFTVTNIGNTVAAPLSTALWARHDGTLAMVDAGGAAADSAGLEAFAEDGDPSGWLATIAATAGVVESGTIDTQTAAGASFEIVLTPNEDNRFLSIATGLAATNDAFIAPFTTGVALLEDDGTPRANDDIEEDFRRQLVLWDAGTEANEVPGVGANTQAVQSAPGDGAADPDATLRPYSDITNDLSGPDAGGFLSVTIVNGTALGEFDVTITNTSDTTAYPGVLSPPLWTVHDDTVTLFTPGAVASPEIESLAEDGDPIPLFGDLGSAAGVIQVGAGPGPLDPGESYQLTLTTVDTTYPFFSIASMVVPSNDTFVAFEPTGVRLVDDAGTPFTDAEIATEIASQLAAWESGTEANQAGAIGRDQAPRQAAENTGVDEGNGLVRFTEDDPVWAWPDADQIIRVTVGPTGN
jgi:hypothetical protein